MHVSGPPARRLTIGPNRGAKVRFSIIGILLLCLSCPVGSIVGVTASWLTGAGGSGEWNLPGAALGALATLGIVTFAAVAAVGYFRTAVWLEGTTVVKRGLRTRRVDLASAEIAGDTLSAAQSLGNNQFQTVTSAAVRARDPRTGVTITFPVRTPGRGRLPPDQLVAVADAIMAGRHSGNAGHQQAEAVARALRGMAANPFPV